MSTYQQRNHLHCLYTSNTTTNNTRHYHCTAYCSLSLPSLVEGALELVEIALFVLLWSYFSPIYTIQPFPDRFGCHQYPTAGHNSTSHTCAWVYTRQCDLSFPGNWYITFGVGLFVIFLFPKTPFN